MSGKQDSRLKSFLAGGSAATLTYVYITAVRMTMTRELIETKAFDAFQSGFHCAEAVSKTLVEAVAGRTGEELPRCATGFGGGMGGSHEEACGAFTGGVIALGCIFGRMEPGADKQQVTELTAAFRQAFIDRFGATRCQTILDGFGKQENMMRCKRLTATTAGLLWEMITAASDQEA